MGDMGDFFRDWTAAKKEDKERRLVRAQENDDGGWYKHTEYHWSRTVGADRLDYWPSSGRWRIRGHTFYGQHSDLMNFIRRRTK